MTIFDAQQLLDRSEIVCQVIQHACKQGPVRLDGWQAGADLAAPNSFKRNSPMPKTSLKNVQKQKKKARRAIPRAKVTRIQGNTTAVRKRLKKNAGKARAAKAAS